MPHPLEITRENFDATVDRMGIVLLDWWAKWCPPCRMFAPVFDAAADRHQDLVFGKVDTEAQAALAGAFEIQSIPTLMIFRDGLLVFARPGVFPEATLERLIAKTRALDMNVLRAEFAQGALQPAIITTATSHRG